MENTNKTAESSAKKMTNKNDADYWAKRIAQSIQGYVDTGLLTQAQADNLKEGLN